MGMAFNNFKNILMIRSCFSLSLEGDQNEVEGGSEGEEESEPEMWEESIGGHTDSKPNGPEAVAMDFAFTGLSGILHFGLKI